jgi:hypothetical protein
LAESLLIVDAILLSFLAFSPRRMVASAQTFVLTIPLNGLNGAKRLNGWNV